MPDPDYSASGIVNCSTNPNDAWCRLQLVIGEQSTPTGHVAPDLIMVGVRLAIRNTGKGGTVRLAHGRVMRAEAMGSDLSDTDPKSRPTDPPSRWEGLQWPYRDYLGAYPGADTSGDANNAPANGSVSADGLQITGIVARASLQRYFPGSKLARPGRLPSIPFYSATLLTDDPTPRDVTVDIIPEAGCKNQLLYSDGRAEPLALKPCSVVVRVPINHNMTDQQQRDVKPMATAVKA